MIPKITLSVLLNALFMAAGASAADTYAVDPVHSSVEFIARHLVISKVKGNFTDFSGTILFDEKDITKSRFSGVIKAASINTENERRDNHLRSPGFFDAQNYPEIRFETEHVERDGETYVAIGKLTIRDVTKEVHIPFKFLGTTMNPGGKNVIVLEANMTLNRQDYGVSWSKTVDNGGLVVANEVEVELNVEAIKQ